MCNVVLLLAYGGLLTFLKFVASKHRNLLKVLFTIFFFRWLDSPIWVWASSFRRGFMITHIRHTTVGRTPLDEGPGRRRDLYLTTNNTHKTQISMPPGWIFFVCPGFFPFDPFLYFLNPFRPSCHFTFHATVLIQQTQHKHPCPRWDFFFVCPEFFPFDPILYCIKSFCPSCHLCSILPS
jgi:hypothetical protein